MSAVIQGAPTTPAATDAVSPPGSDPKGVKRGREDGDDGPVPKRAEPESAVASAAATRPPAPPPSANATGTTPVWGNRAPPKPPPSQSAAATAPAITPTTTDPYAGYGGAGGGQEEQQSTKLIGVPDEMVGKIIGKLGSTIKQIQDISGAHMDIAKACEPGVFDRTITITGIPSQIEKCEELIRTKIDGGNLPVAPSVNGIAETVVQIPDDMVGRVIGKGGSTIKEIQDQSGAHMDIAKECTPGTNTREVTIRGDPNQMAYCNLLLQSKIGNPDPNLAAYTQAFQGYQAMQQGYGQYAAYQQYGAYAGYAGYGQQYAGYGQQYGGYYGQYGQQAYGQNQQGAQQAYGQHQQGAQQAYGQHQQGAQYGYGQQQQQQPATDAKDEQPANGSDAHAAAWAAYYAQQAQAQQAGGQYGNQGQAAQYQTAVAQAPAATGTAATGDASSVPTNSESTASAVPAPAETSNGAANTSSTAGIDAGSAQ